MATPPESSPSITNPDTSVSSEEGPASYFCHHCQAAYRHPKILKCLHSFCTECLDHISADDKTSVKCPLCSHVTDLPPGGTPGLTSNSFIQRISNEYVAELKNNLASKSSTKSDDASREQDGTLRQSAPLGTTNATFRQELEQHRFANMTDEQKSKTVNTSSTTDTGTVSSEGGEKASGQEAMDNMYRLQAKLVGLQGEALRVTYAIDRVNHHKIEWLQHREDLKRAIQRRSAQFQMLVKKMERQLIAQVDNKSVEDKLYESLERGKTDLRKNLKQVLHEVSVMKSLREMGNYDEINELSPCLLSPSVGVSKVDLDKISYQLDLPTKSIDEMVRVGFGNLVMTATEKNVYNPELKDYANLKLDEISSEDQSSQSFAFKRVGIVSAISGDHGTKPKRQRSASTVGRQGQRRDSDAGKNSVLEEFQSARESLRNRRQEILQQGHAMVDVAPFIGDGRRLSRPVVRRNRGQSLDRGFRESERSKTILKLQSDGRGRSFDDDDDTRSTSSTDTTGEFSANNEIKTTSNIFKAEVTMPSPIKEENVSVTSPPTQDTPDVGYRSSLTKTKSAPLPISPVGPASSDRMGLHEAQGRHNSSYSPTSSSSSSRRASFEHSPSMSPTFDHLASDLYGQNKERHLRRAITSAADKKAKIEYLRENWQKRKEILIQNQGFVTSEEYKSPKPDSKGVVALISTNSSQNDSGNKADNGIHTQIPLASRGIGSPPLRSKFTSVKRTQQEQNKFQEKADLVRKSSVESNSEKDNPVKSKIIPASILSDEIDKIEVSNARVESRQTFYDSDKGKNQSASQGNDEDDEEMVVETETISIPVTGELINEIKQTNIAGRISSQNSALPVDVNTQNTKTEDIQTVKETAKASLNENQRTNAPSLTQTERPIYYDSSSSRGLYTSRTNSYYSASTALSSKLGQTSDSSADMKTETVNPKASQEIQEQKENPVEGSASISSQQTTTSLPSSSRLYASINRMQNETSLPATPTATLITSSAPTTATTTEVTPAPTISAPSSSASATSISTSTSSSSSSSTYTGRYSRRYIPKVSHIDTTALFASFSNTPKSPTEKAKIGTEDNKENISLQQTASSNSNKQNETDRRESSAVQKVQSFTENKTQTSTKRELKEDTSCNTNPTEQGQSTSQTLPGSSYQRRYYTSSVNQTTSLYSAPNIPDNKQSADLEKSEKPNNNNIVTSETKETVTSPLYSSTKAAGGSGSMYSRFYTNPNTQYSQPTQVQSTPQEDLNVSIQDQQVDQTFTEAESTRRRYDPGTKAARNRRHTVEISKTIPTGAKILDLYKEQESAKMRRSSFQTSDTIEEVPAEADSESSSVERRHQFRNSAFSSSSEMPTSGRAEMPPRQHSLPDRSDMVFGPSDRTTKFQIPMTLPTGQRSFPSRSGRTLSTSSSPASSPMTEEKSFLLEEESALDSKDAGGSQKNLKEIARKKRERWRRLTVY